MPRASRSWPPTGNGGGVKAATTASASRIDSSFVLSSSSSASWLGPVSVGGALVDAKQDYLAATPDMRGLHRKALIISTVFGLPMTSVDLPGGPIVGPGDTSIVGTPTVFAAGPGEVLGLGYADVTIAEPYPAGVGKTMR